MVYMPKVMTIHQYLNVLKDKKSRMKNEEILRDFLNYKFDGGNQSFNVWADRNRELIEEKLQIMKSEGIS